MFDPGSRYGKLPRKQYTLPDGRALTYAARRFLPRGEDLPLLHEVTSAGVLRLDHLAARALGDPQAYWRICDANNAMHPEELVTRPGRVLRVAIFRPGDE